MSDGDDEMSFLLSQSQESYDTEDPFASDPVFENEEEMRKYL